MIDVYDAALPADWVERPLRDVVVRRRGYSWAKEQEIPPHEDRGIPVIRIPDVRETLNRDGLLRLRDVPSPGPGMEGWVDAGWIVFVSSNGNPDRIGDSVLIDDEAPHLFASFLQALSPKDRDELTSAWLAEWMRLHAVHEIVSKTSQRTTGLANFSWSAVKRLPVRFPRDPEEQLRRLDVLGACTRAIELSLREFSTSQDLLATLSEKLVIRGTRGSDCIDTGTRLGLLPHDWQARRLCDVADVASGVTLNVERVPQDNPVQYLTVVNVQRDAIVVDAPRFLELFQSESPGRLLAENDLLVVEGHANRSEIGRAAIAGTEHAGMTFQNHLFRVRPHSIVDPEFLLLALNSRFARRHWSAVSNTSSGLNTINRRQLRRLLVPVPSPSEQCEIVHQIRAAKANVAAHRAKIVALQTVRTGLRRRLLHGAVNVNEVISA